MQLNKTNNMEVMKRQLFIYVFALLMCSCINNNDVYQGESDKGGEAYAEQFSNYTSINVNINSQYEGTVYSIFYNNPYEDGDLVKEPYLTGKTPISVILEVPNDVETLYIIGNGKFIESEVKNITVDDATLSTRASTITDELLNVVNSKYFPEKYNNVWGEELYNCTDLKISDVEGENFNEAEVWITYLHDGGFSNSNQYGKLWFYTYQTEKRENLEIPDCTFYGKENDEVVQIDFSDINKNEDNRSSGGKYIFWSKEENENAKRGIYTRISLGRFAKGLNVGFVFRGPNERPQFTTPNLNKSNTQNDFIEKDYNYIGRTITYKDSKANEGEFTITKPVSNGFIHHMKVDGFEGNILGMENRTPGWRSYDGDYNDMLCLIGTNPVTIQPEEPITPPVVTESTTKKGYYLFEDNYPSQGDFDFNDVVVEYKVVSYTGSNKSKTITAKLLANGCSYANEFGFKDANGYQTFFEGVQGFNNVRGSSDETSCKTVTKTLTGDVEPYLNNGKGYIFNDEYNTDFYPYVLDIPISDDSASFRWCIEGNSISAAYSFDTPRVKDWYKKPKDESLVIER